MANDESDRRRLVEDAAPGVPLAAIFVLTAFCCVLAAMLFHAIRVVMQREASVEQLVVTTVLGGFSGMLLGGLLGLAQRAPLVGMLVGAPTGFVLGAVTAPIVLVPTSGLSSVMTTTIGGAAAIVIMAIIMRALGARN